MRLELLELYKQYIKEIKEAEKDFYEFPGGLRPKEPSFEGFMYWLEEKHLPYII